MPARRDRWNLTGTASPAPASTAAHRDLFRCDVRFRASATTIELDAATLSLPIHTANAGALAVLERYMTMHLNALPHGTSIVEHVRTIVARTLRRGLRPSVSATAHELRASPRTLQRRLLVHGTSHSAVVDAVREDIARRLVAERNVSVTEMAFLTGFRDVSGFRRTYKRWTGHAPSREGPSTKGGAARAPI